jgi:hypothetical protein
LDDEPNEEPRKPSKVPSWIVLGFVLGAAFVMALPRHEAPQPPAPEEKPAAPAPRPPARISTIEAVFEAWDQYAVWDDDRTQVALWDSSTRTYADCYEVLKTPDGYYFRSIPELTQPVLTHGIVQDMPLQFTETERQRAEWLGEVQRENWKAITDGARRALAPAPTPAPAR